MICSTFCRGYSLSEKDFGVIDFVRKCEFVLYCKQILDSSRLHRPRSQNLCQVCVAHSGRKHKQILDSGPWILDKTRNVFCVYPASSIQHPASRSLVDLSRSFGSIGPLLLRKFQQGIHFRLGQKHYIRIYRNIFKETGKRCRIELLLSTVGRHSFLSQQIQYVINKLKSKKDKNRSTNYLKNTQKFLPSE